MSHPSTTSGGGLRQHRRRAPFVQVPSSTIRDAGLSFRARGVLAFLLDHPDGWNVDAAYVAHHGKEGREAVEAALRELRAAGYYRLERRRLPGGGFAMGTAIAEEPVAEWADAHATHGGRAVPVRLLEDGTVVEVPASTNDANPQVKQGNGFPGPAGEGTGADVANYSESETDSDLGVTLVGDVTSAPSPSLEAPKRTCPRYGRPHGACGACADDRRALDTYEAELVERQAAERAAAAAADRQARNADRDLELAEQRACALCDADGTATVVLEDQADPVLVRCTHNANSNVRRVEARLATKAATPRTRATASTRARARARTTRRGA